MNTAKNNANNEVNRSESREPAAETRNANKRSQRDQSKGTTDHGREPEQPRHHLIAHVAVRLRFSPEPITAGSHRTRCVIPKHSPAMGSCQ